MNYNYQTKLINETYASLLADRKTVLAACPGAGKTVMGIRIMERYLREHPRANVLVLAHGQLLLREQWESQIRKWSKTIDPIILERTPQGHEAAVRGPRRGAHHFNVYLGLPQAHRLILSEVGNIDLLVVDEAHHYYQGETIKRIIEKLRPGHQLLLTGTPSDYLADPSWNVIGVTIQELLTHGVLSDPIIELVEAKYELSSQDYNQTFNLRGDAKLMAKQTEGTLDQVLTALVSRLTSIHRANPARYTWDPDKSWRRVLQTLDKTMIVCHSQDQARDAHNYFKRLGIHSAISISDLSRGTEEIDVFKGDPNCRLFIVVNRGVLGFDYDRLANLVDLSGTLNVNKLFQMLCRVVRQDRENTIGRKLFLKVCTPQLAAVTHFVMSFVVALSVPRFYFGYKGKMRDMKAPVASEFLERMRDYQKAVGAAAPPFPDLPDLLTFEEMDRVDRGMSVRSIAYTDFATVRRKLGNFNRRDEDEVRALIARYSTRKDFRTKEVAAYKWIIENRCNHLLDDAFGPAVEEHTVEEALATAKQFKTKSAFREAHTGMFNLLKREGRLRLLKFERGVKRWTIEAVRKEAKKYKTRAAFRRKAGGAAEFAERMGIMDELIPVKDMKIWTIPKALELAKRCRSRQEFRNTQNRAYQYLKLQRELSALDAFFGPAQSKRSA